ncbi:MAG: hypothetical protein NC187_08070 [Candidatus Amulumruptor caecigallinarius]|nr:hypothetical protein [Candidatus Amulumruptor caecigallinarius]MCM1397424.1 hypothetical protein [Candidatus Amulumruptor caecigallinarius]MCM1454369.1 hypothetical protein [bacterium]
MEHTDTTRNTLPPMSDSMIIKAAERLNPTTDCAFALEWLRDAAQSEEAKQAVTAAALRLNIDGLATI